MFHSRDFNKSLKGINQNEGNLPSSYPWPEIRQSFSANETQKLKRRKRKCQIKSFNAKDSNMKSDLSLFLQNSSIFVLNRIGNSPTLNRKRFWVTVLIVGLTGCVLQVGQYLTSYYKYPVVVNIDSRRINPTEFPSVTLCNLNPLRRKFLPCMVENNMKVFSDENCTRVFRKTSTENREPFCDIPGITSNSSINYDWKQFFPPLSFEARVKYGHEQNKFIYNCGFNNRECDSDYFKITNTYSYGNCFTFNPDAFNSIAYNSTIFDDLTPRLDIAIDLELDEYTDFTQSVGARVQIHDPSLPHDIETKGIALSPGFNHLVAVTKSEISRLPAPFKDSCKRYDVEDSQDLCKKICLNELIRSKCFCSQWLKSDDNDDLRQCDLTNPLILCCVSVLQDALSCDCPLSCHEIEYDTQLSSTVWPSKLFHDDQFHKNDSTIEDFRETHLSLEVVYDKMESKICYQTAAYQSSELLSLIGGLMGLWLGLSLTAMLGCIESIVNLCRSRKTFEKAT